MDDFFQINFKDALHLAAVIWIHYNPTVADSLEVNPIEYVIALTIASTIYEE